MEEWHDSSVSECINKMLPGKTAVACAAVHAQPKLHSCIKQKPAAWCLSQQQQLNPTAH
jgi:hypothetical protein